MSGRRPRRGLVAVLACLALLLAGCVSIPTSGRVVAGGDISQQGVRSALRVTAAGPAEGADARQVVEGFLAAVAGLEDYSVARQFLAPEAADWRPGEQTVVYENVGTFAPTIRSSSDDSATVSVRTDVVARIDEAGRFTEQATAPEEQVFDLTRVDGEWRISQLPPGVLVSEVDAGRVLTQFGVYFADPTGSYLVPDVRWFPQLTSSATSLVRALLDGPSAPYLGALRSAAPAGTRLDLPTVPVENGVATVDLTEEVLLAERGERALLLSQLAQTLRAVPGVVRVVVTVDGSPLDEPVGSAAVGAPALVVDPSVDDRPLVLAPPPEATPGPGAADEAAEDAGGEDAASEDAASEDAASEDAASEDASSEDAGTGEVAPLPEPAPVPSLGPDGRPVAPPGSVVVSLDPFDTEVVAGTEALAESVATGLAVARDGNTVAGLDATRRTLWVQQPGAAPMALVSGTGLTTPSFDPPPLAWVWTVSAPDSEAEGAPRVLAAAASVEQVEARWLVPGDEVRALRISRDGARALVVLAHADGSVEVQVRGVRRDATGRPLSLSQAAFQVAVGLTDALDASWVNDDQVVVLGRVGEESPRPVVAQVGGTSTPLAPTPGAATVTAALGERTIVVGTVDGTVLRRSGGLWLVGPAGVSPAFGG